MSTPAANVSPEPQTQSAPKKEGKAPLVGGAVPLLGHALKFTGDTFGLLERARAECGDVARIRLMGRDVYILTGPEAHEAYFRAPDEQLNPRAPYKMMNPVFGKGVAYDTTLDRMTEQLHMLLPALQDKRMRTYGEYISQEVELSTKDWGDEGVIPLYEYTATLTNFTSSRCLLGKEFREELNEEFAKVYHDLEGGVTPLALIHAHLPLPAFIKRDRARAKLGAMVTEIIEKRKQSGYEGEDLLQTLMESTYKDGSKLSDHEVTGMLVAAMFAGHHTSAVTAAWSLLELIQHPEALAKVREELAEVLGDDGEISYMTVRRMRYLEGAIKEALRLHPPLFVLFRQVEYDFEVNGYTIPKGSWVAISPHVAHRIEEVFPHTLAYEPERYLPGRAEDKQNFAFIAFGGGRHKCLGNAFAILQLKVILATLLQKYEFELYGDPVEPEIGRLVVGPKGPCRVRYRRIK